METQDLVLSEGERETLEHENERDRDRNKANR